MRKNALEQIEGAASITQGGINAGDIVLRPDVVRICGQGSRQPLPRTVLVAKRDQSRSAKVGRPRIFGLTREPTLCPFHRLTRRCLHLRSTTERAVDLNG